MGLQQQLTGIMGATLSKNGKIVEKLAEVQYEESFFMHGWAIDQAVGVELKWGLLNEKTVEAAVRAPEWRALKDIAIRTLKTDSIAKIDRVITQGLIQGQSYQKMAKAIKEHVLEPSAANAIRIARTEGHRAAVEGALKTYDRAREELDIDVENIWDATLDRRTRPEHGARDGKAAVEHDGELMWYVQFPDGGSGWTRGPGLSGNASDSINCRCRIRPQIKGYGPKVRRVRDEGVRDYITYDEWVKEKGL
jgi:SPP1 gp7 family putative phage head morphogenesis protein